MDSRLQSLIRGRLGRFLDTEKPASSGCEFRTAFWASISIEFEATDIEAAGDYIANMLDRPCLYAGSTITESHPPYAPMCPRGHGPMPFTGTAPNHAGLAIYECPKCGYVDIQKDGAR
jgi:hypothetical protein